METIENPNVPTPFYRSEVVICDKCKSESVEPVFEQHLCKLKYKCATSLAILVVLLLEALVRRVESIVQSVQHE